MGFFSKLFKGPEIDMEKSDANAKKMRALFHQAVGVESFLTSFSKWRYTLIL